MARIVVSYAQENLNRAVEVHGWLIAAGHEVVLDRDPPVGTPAAELWRQRLVERLRWADAMVCVVTPAYLASSWCTAEVAIALSRGGRLLPLRVEPGVDHPLLADIQHIDLLHEPTVARAALIEAVHRVDAAGGVGWPYDRSPFPGLRPFQTDQHRVFFGRAGDVKALAERVRSATEGAVLLVVGPSGCGKSSLVRAGLVPAMAAEPGWRVLPPILPGADPVAALPRELAAAARRVGLDWTVDQVHQRLDTQGLAGLADELLLADPDGPRRRLLIVIDQFEELLTHTTPDRRARFAELVCPALTGPVRVVGTVRPEFLGQVLADADLAAAPTEVHPLRPLPREALRLVIEGPARLAGIDIDEHLVARLMADTDSGEALPLLAFSLAQLTDGMRPDERLSIARYEQLGGVRGALTSQADAALAEVVDAGRRSREEVLTGLLRLVTVDEQGHPTRWRVPRDELPAAVVADLRPFVARRLLTTDTLDGTVVIGAAHEAFLSAWPPLADAITTNVTALRARSAVEQAAVEWDGMGRPPIRLWSGGQLAAAVTNTGARTSAGSAPPPRRRGRSPRMSRRPRILITDRVDLSTTACDFLHAGIRRERSRRGRAVTVLSVLLILVLVGTGVAVGAQREAQDRQQVATAGRLLGDAEAARTTDLRTALLLGLAVHRLDPGGRTHSSLVNTLAGGPYAGTLTGHTGWVVSVAFSPDGNTLATGSEDSTVILWDLTDPAGPRQLGQPLTGHGNSVESVAFSPDGNILATGSIDQTVILWDLADPVRPRLVGQPLSGHTDWVNSVAFAPDGRMLVSGGADNTAILWDVTDPAQPRRLGSPLVGHTGPVNDMVITPDGRTLITGSADNTAILWDVTDPAQPRRLGSPLVGHTGPVNDMALTPDGHTLATDSSETGTVILWDLTDRAQPSQLGSPLKSIVASPMDVVAFAPEGRTLATGGIDDADSVVILWDVTDPARPHPLGPPLRSTSTPTSMVFTPDGQTLVTGGSDGSVTLWNLADPVQPHRLGPPLAGYSQFVRSITYSPDGQTLAAGSTDGTAILWDLTDRAQPRQLGEPLTGPSDSQWSSVAFAPHGHTLATITSGTAILWEVADPARPRRLGPSFADQTDGVTSVAFSPDGSTLATGTFDGTVDLWDVTDRTQPSRLGMPLTGHTNVVASVAFSPDGSTLATGSQDTTVILWDLTDRAQPRQLGPTLTEHTGEVWSVAFAPNGRTLATGGFDGTVLLWDVTDRARPRRLGTPLISSAQSLHNVWSVAFSPDGRTLAVGTLEAILWDVTDREQPRRLGPPLTRNVLSVNVAAVAFSPDGRALATGTSGVDFSGTAILWDLTDINRVRDHAVQRACSITHGGLTRNEWRRYIPDLPYQDTCPPADS